MISSWVDLCAIPLNICHVRLQIDVLKDIGCIDFDQVKIKERVACEMNSEEELLYTECLFEN